MEKDYIIVGASVLLAMLVLDALWLGVVARRYYQTTLRRVVAFEVRWLPAVGFYLLHTVALLVFVLAPNAAAGVPAGLGRIGVMGAFLGACTYGTYDLTNMATIRDWPWHLTALDILWGMLVTSLSGLLGAVVLGWL